MGNPIKKLGKSIKKRVSGLLGGLKKMPAIQIPALAQVAAPQAAAAPVDAEAMMAAKDAIEREKLRKGRKALRTDLAVGGGSGAGVAL